MQPQPLPYRPSGSPVAIPPPLAGINEADDITALKPADALRMVNFIPRPDGLHVRGGSEKWTTVAEPVDNLVVWAGQTAFATGAGGIYEVRRGASAKVVTLSGSADNGCMSGDMLSNPGGAHLVVANGVDRPWSFNGAAWRQCGITGVNEAALHSPTFLHRRMWFAERGTADLWYLAPGAIGGVASCLPVAPLLRRGGTIAAIMSRRGDTGVGRDDQLVVLSSEGELAVFSGTDPDNAATWSLMGVYEAGVPLGWRPLARVGGDVVVMTVAGLFQTQTIIESAKERRSADAVSGKISTTWDYHAQLPRHRRWQCLETTADGGLLIVNRPDGGQSAAHLGRWTSLAGHDVVALADSKHGLLAATADGGVRLMATGSHDDGADIDAEFVGGYHRFGGNRMKRVTRIRPNMVSVLVKPRFHVLSDYQKPAPSYVPTTAGAAGAELGMGWSDADRAWTTPAEIRRWGWSATSGRGHALAVAFSVRTRAPLVYNGCDLLVTAGGGI